MVWSICMIAQVVSEPSGARLATGIFQRLHIAQSCTLYSSGAEQESTFPISVICLTNNYAYLLIEFQSLGMLLFTWLESPS